MCQATVYLDEQKIMEDVIWMEPTADGFLLRTFFGEPREIKGAIVGIDGLLGRTRGRRRHDPLGCPSDGTRQRRAATGTG
jgi:predicted RNA-binding protein